MADTERPKRLRGAKLLEEGYAAGYDDGYARGLQDAARADDTAKRREADIARGMALLRMKLAGQPKRTWRTKPAGPRNTTTDSRTDEQKLRDLAQERSDGV